MILANVTHELRTSIHSWFIDTLKACSFKDQQTPRRFLDIIDIEAERLEHLIDDILALSEIEENKTEKNISTFDLHELVDDVAVLLDDYASEHNVALIPEPGEGTLMVTANEERLKQILINLTDNAIKYNRPGGRVYLSVSRKNPKRVRIEVRDTGIGIPAEQVSRIFERFYRVDHSRSRDLGGTGLGLSIVKHIARLYEGKAFVHSEPGKGSTFFVDLTL